MAQTVPEHEVVLRMTLRSEAVIEDESVPDLPTREEVIAAAIKELRWAGVKVKTNAHYGGLTYRPHDIREEQV